MLFVFCLLGGRNFSLFLGLALLLLTCSFGERTLLFNLALSIGNFLLPALTLFLNLAFALLKFSLAFSLSRSGLILQFLLMCLVLSLLA